MGDSVPSTRDLAVKIRAHVLRMTHKASAPHVGACLSMADILAALYNGILRVDPSRPACPDRDRFILSKGHSAAAMYAVLAERGFFPKEWLDTFCCNAAKLDGHVAHFGVPGVEVSTGSLGHGLSIGCGMALAGKRDGRSYRVFVVIGDGECDEGSIWEAALFAPHHRLDNLVAIIDHNKIQGFGRVSEVLNLQPLAAKWRSFGWAVREIEGHNCTQIEHALKSIPLELGRPTCIIAHTVKGKGVSFMEDQLAWHYKSPNAEELVQALVELGCKECTG